jgi:CTP synthase
MRNTKYIVITGGVLSGLGKGIASASIGHLLSDNYKVIPVKCDGYLNVDPGTMNPIEHGEVFVLDDGGEVDMDFGHYERYLGVNCKFKWNLTMGKIFEEIRNKERRGDYLGKTVQLIPHVTDLIKLKFKKLAEEEEADILLIEIGGTVGDIENELFIEAVRELEADVGRNNVAYVHLTYVPLLSSVGEQKSKPTQQSLSLLRERGIQPDVIIARCKGELEDKIRGKIALFGGITREAVISAPDVGIVYDVPIKFYESGIMNIINKKLNIKAKPKVLKWIKLLNNLKAPKKEINVAICGKYTALEDSYASVIEALKHCAAHFACKINLKWIETTDIEEGVKRVENVMKNIHGIIVPGGFGARGAEGKIEAIKYARENSIPFLGLCYGMQLAVIEFARNACGMKNANSTEIDEKTKYPVIDLLPEQKNVQDKGATMRLGGHDVHVVKGSKAYKMFGKKVRKRFRHRWEVNPKFVEKIEKNGMVFSGKNPDGRVMQILEIPNHKYFMATQAHPELTSSLENPSKLFYEFVKACL